MIESIEPDSGPVGFSPVFIRGTGLAASEVQVYFGEVRSAATDVSTDGTWIETAVPGGARTGMVRLLLDGVRVDGPTFTVTAENPRPRVTSVTPPKVKEGSGRTRVVLAGLGFLADSIVRFDGGVVTVDSWSATSVAVTLGAALLETAALHEFSVENGPPGGGVSEPAIFSVWEPFHLLAARPTSATSLELEFSSPPDPVAAVDETLYAISGGHAVVRAELGSTETTVELTTARLTTGTSYIVVVSRSLSSKYGAELGLNDAGFTGY